MFGTTKEYLWLKIQFLPSVGEIEHAHETRNFTRAELDSGSHIIWWYPLGCLLATQTSRVLDSPTGMPLLWCTGACLFFISMKGIPTLPGVWVKVLGIILYSALSHPAHLQIISKSCWFHLPNVSRMRPFLLASTTTFLAKPASQWEKMPPRTRQYGLHTALPPVPAL